MGEVMGRVRRRWDGQNLQRLKGVLKGVFGGGVGGSRRLQVAQKMRLRQPQRLQHRQLLEHGLNIQDLVLLDGLIGVQVGFERLLFTVYGLLRQLHAVLAGLHVHFRFIVVVLRLLHVGLSGDADCQQLLLAIVVFLGQGQVGAGLL